jgi:hypothetical protein
MLGELENQFCLTRASAQCLRARKKQFPISFLRVEAVAVCLGLAGALPMLPSAQAQPTLLASVPTNGASGVSVTAPVVFTFSTAMNSSRTSAQFMNPLSPLTPLAVNSAWSPDETILTCTPASSWPTNGMVLWVLSGQDIYGNALQESSGLFYTAGSGGSQGGVPAAALASRGELIEQTGAANFEAASPEFMALAAGSSTNGLTVTAPAPGGTNVLGYAGWTNTLEFEDYFSTAAEFATNYPAGGYTLTLLSGGTTASATLNLADGPLPSSPRLLNWGSKPHTLLGQDYTLQWDLAAGGPGVDYMRVRVEQNGAVLFATPLPGAPGALTGASNTVVLPAAVLTNAGMAELRLTAISFTAVDTNSIAGATLRAGCHRTTVLDFWLVDGSVPPPLILTSNVTGIGFGMPSLIPLQTSNGVPPLTFELTSGTLPPGLSLNSEGSVSGQATSLGTCTAAVQVTDFLGRSSVQTISLTTVPPDGPGEAPCLAYLEIQPGPVLACDLLCATGVQYVIETSLDLRNWSPVQTCNALTNCLSLVLPVQSGSAFFRARGPGLPPLPPPHPLTVQPLLNTNVTASAWFSPLGGTLSLTNSTGYSLSLVLPPGALEGSETITMTEIAQVGGLPLDNGLNVAVDLQPEGLWFVTPARLDITPPSGVQASNLVGFSAHGDGSEFALTPTFITNGTVSVWLGHFSMAGQGSGSAASIQAQAQNNVPSDPMAGYTQQIAQQLAGCRADPSCNLGDIAQQIGQTALQAFAQVVRPALTAAETDDTVLDAAANMFLQWWHDVELLGLTEGQEDVQQGKLARALQRCINEGLARLQRGILNAFQNACQACLNHDLEKIAKMFRLAHDAALLSMPMEAEFNNCLDRCLRFRVDLDSEIVATGGSVLGIHTKAKVKLRFVNGDVLSSINKNGTMFMSGSASWTITDMQFPPVKLCVVVEAPKSGTLSIPSAWLQLFKTTDGTNYVYSPDFTMAMNAQMGMAPSEGRTLYCPQEPPQPITDLYGPTFNALHVQAGELKTPPDLLAEYAGSAVFVITGWVGPGSGEDPDVILERTYSQWLGNQAYEFSTFTLHHTPAQ